MILTLKGLSKNGKNAFYLGAKQPLRLGLSSFPNKTAPEMIEVADGVFEPAKAPKAKLTKEERAKLPKPTIAERAVAARKRADDLEKKAAAAAAM